MGSHSPLLYFSVSRSNFTKAQRHKLGERGNRTPPSISFSGLEMVTLNLGDGELEEKVQSVSEATRNMFGRKERIIKQGLKAGIYCTLEMLPSLKASEVREKLSVAIMVPGERDTKYVNFREIQACIMSMKPIFHFLFN